ncbi:MAG: YabP/YqfC family sporulation protein [Clostridia bacterium]|nr:YabP/YqfC family sporulation protein [Clostridia bacterium]
MQQITITDGKGAAVTEVKDVLSFSEKEIKLLTRDNKRLLIEGAGLKIGGFSKANGELTAEGTVTLVRYLGARESFIKKVFK